MAPDDTVFDVLNRRFARLSVTANSENSARCQALHPRSRENHLTSHTWWPASAEMCPRILERRHFSFQPPWRSDSIGNGSAKPRLLVGSGWRVGRGHAITSVRLDRRT